MVSGISGNNNNWANVVVNTEEQNNVTATEGPVKTAAVATDSFEVTGASANAGEIPPGMADKVPSGGIGGWVAETFFGYDVSILKDEAGTLPTSRKQMKSWASTLGLSYSQQKTAGKVYDALEGNEAALNTVFAMMQSPEFVDGDSSYQNCIMSLAMQFPNNDVLQHVAKLSDMAWFKELSSEDKQRACWLVGYLANGTLTGDVSGNHKYMYTALDRLMSGQVGITFVDDGVFSKMTDDKSMVQVTRCYIPTGSGKLEDSQATNLDRLVGSMSMHLFFGSDISYTVSTALDSLEANTSFKELDVSVKLAFIKMVQSCNGDESLVNLLNVTIGSEAFKALSVSAQTAFISQLGDKTSAAATSLQEIIESPWLRQMSAGDQVLAINLAVALNAQPAGQSWSTSRLLKEGVELFKAGDFKLQFSADLAGDYQVADNVVTINSQVAADPAALNGILQNLCQELETIRQQVKVPMANLADLTASDLYKNLEQTDKALVQKLAKGLKGAEDYQNLSLLLSSLAANSSVDTTAALEAAAAAKTNPGEVAGALAHLVNSRSFARLTGEQQHVLLAQCKNYPTKACVTTLAALPVCAWFTKMEVADMQRAAKTIVHCANVEDNSKFQYQKDIIANSLTLLLTDKVGLSYVDIQDDPGCLTGGYTYGDHNIYLNRKIVSANDKLFTQETSYDVIEVICHECNHEVNGDDNRANYKYYQAEYRAWYVGFAAANGRVPTQQEAFDRSYALFSLYGTINKALYDCGEESQKIQAFLSQIAGKELKATTEEEIRAFRYTKLSNPKAPAQDPDPIFNPDMDN